VAALLSTIFSITASQTKRQRNNDMASPRFFSMMKHNLPPNDELILGDLYYTTDTREIFISLGADGGLVNYALSLQTPNFFLGYPRGILAEDSDVSITNPNNGEVLTYDSTSGTWQNKAAGPSTLAGDTDVAITSPADADVLTYDAGSSKWENKPAATGSSTLASDSDVALTSPTDGDLLTYDAGSSKWENKPAAPVVAAPLWPRAGAGSWRVWFPTGLGVNGDHYSSGSFGSTVYQPAYNVTYPPIVVVSDSGSGSALDCALQVGPPMKPYFKCRAIIDGGNAYSGLNATAGFRAWLGMGENASGTNYASSNPSQNIYAFRYCTDVDSTIKCMVRNAFSGTSGWAAPAVIDTGIVPDQQFHDYVIDMSDGAHIKFFIDGTQVASVANVNGPTGPVWPNDLSANPFAAIQSLSGGTYIYLTFQYIYVDFPIV
jgi:hypothetical protein